MAVTTARRSVPTHRTRRQPSSGRSSSTPTRVSLTTSRVTLTRARYEALAAAGKIPASLAKLLPPASEYKGVQFATVEQITKASAVVVKHWDTMVGGM